MGADVRLVVALLLAQAAARVHTVLLTPSTPSPSWLLSGPGDTLNFTLHAGRPAARVVQSSRAAPCTPLVHGFARALDAGRPFFLWHPADEEEEEVWFYLDGECAALADGQRSRRLARRKDLDWAQLWGIVLGIAFGLVALAAMACCSWCCCFQHRVRAHQARLHVRDEGVQTAAAQDTELPLYERRVREGEVQLEEAPAPDYHLATRASAAPEEEVRAPEDVPLPPSPGSPADARHPMASPRDPPTQSSPPDDLPPAYSHAPPTP